MARSYMWYWLSLILYSPNDSFRLNMSYKINELDILIKIFCYWSFSFFSQNWPKLAWCIDSGNVYTMYTVQLFWTNCVLFLCAWFSYELLLYLINLFYWHRQKSTHNSINTRTNSFFFNYSLLKIIYILSLKLHNLINRISILLSRQMMFIRLYSVCRFILV